MTAARTVVAVLVLAVAAGPVRAACPAPATAAADLEHGRRAFLKCRACHTVAADDKHLVGPNLWSVFTRPALGATGFAYSPAFTAAKTRWSVAEFDSFIEKPSRQVPGTRMIFAGIADARERANLTAWLANVTGCAAPAQ